MQISITNKTAKTKKPLSEEASERKIIIKRHKKFIKDAVENSLQYPKRYKISRILSYVTGDDGIVLPGKETYLEEVLETKVRIHGEYAAFTFNLTGCPAILLTYILFYEFNPEKGTFKYSEQLRCRFESYCRLFDVNGFTKETLKKALSELVNRNIVLSIKGGFYMVNPLVAGGGSQISRKAIIDEYTRQLIKKDKDPVFHFYPVATSSAFYLGNENRGN